MIINYILSSFYGLYFLLVIALFHPIEVLAYKIFGWNAQQKVVYALNFCLLYGLYMVGTRIDFDSHQRINTNLPILIIANHQSMYDIMGIYWFLRKYKPVFVAKKSLSSGIPSISYNLRVSGAALINRKDRVQSISELSLLSQSVSEKKRSIVIFPEGTRSRVGLKKFALTGIQTILAEHKNMTIVPVAINGTGKMDAFNIYPIRAFQCLSWQILKPFESKGLSVVEIIQKSKTQIENGLQNKK